MILIKTFFRFLPELLMPIVTINEVEPHDVCKSQIHSPKKRGRPRKNESNEAAQKMISTLQKAKIRIREEFKAVNLEEEVPRFTCHVCKDNMKRTEKEFRIHFREAHKGKRLRASKLSTEIYHCDICGKEFKMPRSLKEHMEIHNNQFHCEECDISYKKVSDYVLHMRIHSPNDVFACIFCEFCTDSIKDITEHLNVTHDKNPKYFCKLCNKGFYILSWYQEHENFHTGARPFVCEFCGKHFPYSRYLAAHRRSIHRDIMAAFPMLHECVICKKQYQHKNSLKLHMNVHTGNIAICDICGKQLSSQEKLKFHLRTHTGYKPFSCTYCGKCFTKKPILVEHERVHTGEKPYECHFCTKAFSQRSSLVIHIRSHTGERPYVCHVCNKGFVAKAMLNIHFKTCKGLIV